MKSAIALTIVIVIALLACGCTTQAPTTATPGPTVTPAAPQATTPSAQIPNITGTWTGTSSGYTGGIGFSDYGNGTMSMIVTEQHGRVFAGQFVFNFDNMKTSDTMAGIISADGKTLSLVEENNGYTFGTISGNAIELTYLNDNKPVNADIDTLKRV